MEKDAINFIQSNSPDGGFLQSEEWRKFQESAGNRTFHIESQKSPSSPPFEKGEDFFWANVIEHKLPIVGSYFYIPRGPVMRISNSPSYLISQPEADPPLADNKIPNLKSEIKNLINLAKENNIGWIRIEPQNEKTLEVISKVEPFSIQGSTFETRKSPHDMQPRELFIIDITKSEEELLAEMKQKTRYNIKLSQKHNVSVKVISNFQFPISNEIPNSNDQNPKFYIDKFIELVKITAERDKITPHPESYYRKMFEVIPAENLKLYVAEYQNKVIAANIIIHYGNTATYLHGASDNEYRNVMAPYLLQWQAIIDAKKAGLSRYDFGGINSKNQEPRTKNSWQGITKFKTGFSPSTSPIVFPGSYDIVVNPFKYYLYRVLQKLKSIF